MKGFFKSALAAVAALCLFTTQQAHAGLIDFAVKGSLGISMDRNSDTTMPTFSSMPAIGFALGGGAEIGLGPVSLMADIYYRVNKSKLGTDANNYIQESTNNIFIPVQAKFTLIPLIGLTGGFYYNTGVGSVDGTVVSGGSSSTTTKSYSAAQIAQTSWGLCGGVTFDLPLGVTTLLAEARLNYGLTNVDTSGTGSSKMFGIDLVAGVKF